MASLTQQQLNRFFEIINASKLPSELAELLSISSGGERLVIQNGTDDAKSIKIPLLRGILGSWDGTTNTPTLIDGTGIEGDSYYVTVEGMQDLGSGVNTFHIGDIVMYISGAWRRRPSTVGYPITTNFSSLLPPQMFNPDASAVSSNTDDYTLANLNDVVIVTINGKVLDDAEYSLSGAIITVTPINGFDDIDDEVLVFQNSLSTLSDGVTANYVSKSADYTVLGTDYTIEYPNGTFTVTLLSAIGIAGQIFNIVNTGTGSITIDTTLSQTINGNLTQTLSQWESLQVQSNGVNWIVL